MYTYNYVHCVENFVRNTYFFIDFFLYNVSQYCLLKGKTI